MGVDCMNVGQMWNEDGQRIPGFTQLNRQVNK